MSDFRYNLKRDRTTLENPSSTPNRTFFVFHEAYEDLLGIFVATSPWLAFVAAKKKYTLPSGEVIVRDSARIQKTFRI